MESDRNQLRTLSGKFGMARHDVEATHHSSCPNLVFPAEVWTSTSMHTQDDGILEDIAILRVHQAGRDVGRNDWTPSLPPYSQGRSYQKELPTEERKDTSSQHS